MPGPFTQERGTDYPASPRRGWARRHVPWLAAAGVGVVAVGFVVWPFLKSRVPFTIRDGRIIIRDTKGGAIEVSREPRLPSGFPSDIPIYPQAKLLPSAVLIESRDPDAQGSLYRWEVPGPLEDIAFWYIRELELRGWSIPTKAAANDGVTMTVIKDGRGFVMTLIGRSSTRTDVSLVFSDEFGGN